MCVVDILTDIFVHVERFDIFEGNFSLLIKFDKMSIHAERSTTRR